MHFSYKTLGINDFISNWNVINIFIGYPLITSILMPLIGNAANTTIVTIPYRAFSLLISIMAIVLNHNVKIKIPIALKMFLFFWFLFLLRMFYDLEIQCEFFIPAPYTQRIWLSVIGICFIPMISVIKSIKKIDLNYCLYWIYRLGIIFLFVSFFKVVNQSSSYERLAENAALNSISFGQIAIMIAIIVLYKMIRAVKLKLIAKIFYISIFMLSFYIALRAGSRGPIIAFLIMFYFWISFKNGKFLKGIIIFSLLTTITYTSKKLLLLLFSNISPILAIRFNQAITGHDLGVMYRLDSYSWFMTKILEHPILGSHFARLSNGQFPGYAHNIFLDILLGFGFFGLLIFLFVIYKALRNLFLDLKNKNEYWIGLIMIQSLVLSFTSGAFYYNPVLNVSIILTLILFQAKSRVNYKNQSILSIKSKYESLNSKPEHS